MTVHFVTNDKIAETSSKGNQEKWFDADTNRWYKLDQFGYEALSETVVSALLEGSNIEKDFPFHFVRYRMEKLHVHDRERNGCSSENFLNPGQEVVTLSRLFNQEYHTSLSQILGKLPSDKQRISWLAEKTVELTGLTLFPQYLTLLFEVDALFLNEDRHLNNIAVLLENGRYDYCSVFDNGAALLSNTQIYQMEIDPRALIKTVRARPFNTTFNRQIIAARNQFGAQLQMPKYGRSEINDVLEPLLPYYASRDRSIIADRVYTCIFERQKV